jgi:hypothetical protein
LSVNSTGKVTNLNADLVDGKHASAFQAPLKLQRVQTIIGKYGGSIYCPAGYRVTGGGYDYGPPGWYTTTGQFVIGSYPTLGAQGWTVGTEPSVVSGSVIGQIWAICVK